MWECRNRVRSSKNLLLYKNSENTDWQNWPNQLFRTLEISQSLQKSKKHLFKKHGWISIRTVSFVAFRLTWSYHLRPIMAVALMTTHIPSTSTSTSGRRTDLTHKELWLFAFTCLVASWRTISTGLLLSHLTWNSPTAEMTTQDFVKNIYRQLH